MLTAECLSLPGKQGRHRLSNVDLQVSVGEFVAIVGPSGSGKTSLLQTVMGLAAPFSGRVTWHSQDLSALSYSDRARLFSWLPQAGLIPEPVPALEYVSAARYRFSEPWSRARAHALSSMETMQAAALAGRLMSELSGGELQRVSLAALQAQQAEMMFLDEPANHLDPAIQQALFTQLAQWAIAGLGIVCVSHDINALSPSAVCLAEAGLPLRVIGLKRGRKAFDLDYDDPILDQGLADLFEVSCSAVTVAARRWFIFG